MSNYNRIYNTSNSREKHQSHLFILFTLLFVFASYNVFASEVMGIFSKELKPNGLVFALYLFLGLVSSLAVHELGHLLSGLAQGFRFQLFIVLLLGVRRTEKGIEIFLNKNLGYMGGVASTIPVTKGPNNRKKFAFMILAGPLSSIAFAILCFLFLFFTKNLLWSFWLITGAASIGIFFATTIPSKTGIYFTDRARFQRLISKGNEGESEEALLELLAQITSENSFKNISLENTQKLQADKESFMRFWGYYYEYEYFKANGDEPQSKKAREQLLNLKQVISKPVWNALKLGE